MTTPPAPVETTYAHRLMALVSLAAVSTSIGIMMKLSLSSNGRFEYSPFAANCMTEFFKLIVSLIIIANFCRESIKTSNRPFLDEFKKFFEDNLTWKLCYHVSGLTCMYVVVNLSIFGVMAHSTASNFFLMKASSPIITAVILVGVFARPIHRAQWISIFAQCLGLVSTQLDLCRGYLQVPLAGYIWISINIAVSCVAGVWNEHIIKTMAPSVNAQNVVMYLLGVVINWILFYSPDALSFLGNAASQPPSFFYGFNWSVFGVIVANGSVGLVITAVYKYADVVVKTFGIAGSVVTLYLLETFNVLPSHGFKSAQGPIAVMGATIVFLASYVYILPASATSSSSSSSSSQSKTQQEKEPLTKLGDEIDLDNEEGDNNNDVDDQEMKKKQKSSPPSTPQKEKEQQQTTESSSSSGAAGGGFFSSWTKMEWSLVILCTLLVTVLGFSPKCATATNTN